MTLEKELTEKVPVDGTSSTAAERTDLSPESLNSGFSGICGVHCSMTSSRMTSAQGIGYLNED